MIVPKKRISGKPKKKAIKPGKLRTPKGHTTIGKSYKTIARCKLLGIGFRIDGGYLVVKKTDRERYMKGLKKRGEPKKKPSSSGTPTLKGLPFWVESKTGPCLSRINGWVKGLKEKPNLLDVRKMVTFEMRKPVFDGLHGTHRRKLRSFLLYHSMKIPGVSPGKRKHKSRSIAKKYEQKPKNLYGQGKGSRTARRGPSH